jgi:hypothetical protein
MVGGGSRWERGREREGGWGGSVMVAALNRRVVMVWYCVCLCVCVCIILVNGLW